MTHDSRYLVLLGTKAQFIKMAPLLREMDNRAVSYELVYTGQHFETFGLLECAFGTRPADEVLVPEFEAKTHGGFLHWTIAFWCAALKRVLSGRWRSYRLALVHGDTASTLFSAMAARMAGIKVAHIEAGLRSPRLLEPFPEEIVRRLVSRLSRVHFVPDEHAASNLIKAKGDVVNTRGNTLQDALLMALGRLEPASESAQDYAIVSLHRSENLTHRQTFDMLMGQVIRASQLFPLRFVLHPATRSRIATSGWLSRLASAPGLTLMERVAYPDFVALLLGCRFLMTDGGSNQEEAAMLGLPTLLLRRTTERQDGLQENVKLSGLDPAAILAFVQEHMTQRWYPRDIGSNSPSSIIVDYLVRSPCSDFTLGEESLPSPNRQ